MENTKIIDCHCHVFPDKIAAKAIANLEAHYKMPWDCDGTLAGLVESEKGFNVVKSVVFSTATKATQVESINNFIASLLNPGLIGFGTIHPDYENVGQEIERIQSLGLKGIKLHPDFQGFAIDSPKMLRVYRCIGGKLPVLIHMGDEESDLSRPYRLAKVLDEFPQLRVIAAHFGGYVRWDEAEECLIGRDIYLDTSSSLYKMKPGQPERFIRKHGADKVLFGTDYPAVCHRKEWDAFSKLDLTDGERRQILYENAAKLFEI